VRGLAVGQHPDVGGDAGVVEEVERQRDDGFEPVVLDEPAADVALALAGVAGEQRRTVVHLGDAAAERRLAVHLRGHVGEEEHLPVAGAGDERELLALVHDLEARVAHAVLAAHGFQVLLPALAVGRIGEHEVELLRAGKASCDSVDHSAPPTMCSALSPSPFSSMSALQTA
jgi:hypothetical protein